MKTTTEAMTCLVMRRGIFAKALPVITGFCQDRKKITMWGAVRFKDWEKVIPLHNFEFTFSQRKRPAGVCLSSVMRSFFLRFQPHI